MFLKQHDNITVYGDIYKKYKKEKNISSRCIMINRPSLRRHAPFAVSLSFMSCMSVCAQGHLYRAVSIITQKLHKNCSCDAKVCH